MQSTRNTISDFYTSADADQVRRNDTLRAGTVKWVETAQELLAGMGVEWTISTADREVANPAFIAKKRDEKGITAQPIEITVTILGEGGETHPMGDTDADIDNVIELARLMPEGATSSDWAFAVKVWQLGHEDGFSAGVADYHG